MKVLTANRLIDGEAVWYAPDHRWSETIGGAEIARDKAHEEKLEAIGKAGFAANQVVDVEIIDVDLVDGAIVPLRLRERIRAAGPTNRLDLGKQARTPKCRRRRWRRNLGRTTTMYRYDEFDQEFVNARVAQFTDQVDRRLAGEITEDQFRPLRLMNGVYLQLHAYMLRIAIPYGTLSARQLRMLAHIARTYDKGYGHFTTRQNIQFNWPALGRHPIDPRRPRVGRDARHPDERKLHPQRHRRSFRRRGRRRSRRSASLCGNPAPVVVGASRIFLSAAKIQDRGDRAPSATARRSRRMTSACT